MFTNKNISRLIIAAILIVSTMHPDISGQTWTSLQGPPKARDVKDIAISKNGQILYACDKSVLFKSTNGGSSWSATTVELSSPLVVACKPDVPSNVVAGVDGIIYLNTNGGMTGMWEPVLEGVGTPLRLAVSPITIPRSKTNQMYLGLQANEGISSIMRSSNGGASWLTPTTSPSGTNINDIAPYPVLNEDSNHVWACGSDGTAEGSNPNAEAVTRGVWLSTDLGVTWSQKLMGDFNVRAIAISDVGPLIFAGTEGTDEVDAKVFVSVNYGASWTKTTSFDPKKRARSIRAIRIRINDIKREVYVATDIGIFRSTDNGGSWSNLMPSGDNNILDFDIVKDN